MNESESDKNLGIYLNDHFAGSTGGSELARRAAGNSTDPERTAMWESVSKEVDEDREILEGMIERIGVSRNPVKAALAWIGEKAGRLKPNGQVSGPSELGQFVELEMMLLGVTGKLALWNALRTADDPRLRSYDFPELIARAESQRDRLGEHRLNLAGVIFSAAR